MKHTGIFSIAGVAVLVAALAGAAWAEGSGYTSYRSSSLSGIMLSDLNADYDETIGSGTLFNSGRSEPEAVIDDSANRPSEFVESDSHEAVGTGSMEAGSAPSKTEWPVGFDARPGIDGP